MWLKPLTLGALLVGLSATAGAQSVTTWTPNNGDGTFTNPILWGDWPDPDVTRVGNTFYMVSTSMHYVPGCPILKSKNLVDWEMAGYAVARYDEDPRYDLAGGSLYLNGSWASSIRYHNGRFYVFFCTPYGWGRDTGHFSVCEADRPEGPWTRTIFPEYLYDPGVLFDDDGRIYVVHGQGTLYVTELNADLKSVKGGARKIWSGPVSNRKGDRQGHPEGSHVYKINGMYYITCPAGGTEGWQVCLRSRSIYGPYEYRVIMDDATSYPPNGLHQGGMVQLQDGRWWFVIMQDRGPIGRVPHLVPVSWQDGWPMLGAEGRDAVTYPLPVATRRAAVKVPATTDEFGRKELGLQWQWNHNPDPTRWSLTERKGYLRLHAAQAEKLDMARNTLTQRVQGPLSQGTVELDVAGLKDGSVAGFGIFQRPYAYLAVTQQDGRRTLAYYENDGLKETAVADLPTDRVWLRARTTDRDFTARFYYSLDGTHFRPVGDAFHMGLGLPWTGNRFALFHFSRSAEGVGGVADFNWFRFTNK